MTQDTPSLVETPPLNKKRIGYIDALRGFTMILVVCVHVTTYSHVNTFPFPDFFGLFRMPLFFFVSGFILYKSERIWNISSSIKFLSQKFLVQIIPTAIFLSLYLFVFSVGLRQRGLSGYWFTVALFDFFLVYTLCNLLIKKQIISNILLLICAVVAYIFAYDPLRYRGFPILNDFIIHPFGFFIFFLLGIISKKHFDKVKLIFNNNLIMAIAIPTMLIGAIFFIKGYIDNFAVKLILSILGLFSVFYFFMKNDNYMDNSRIGKGLQFIGRRTLDIYLLHYFFIKDSMSWIKEWGIDSPTITFVISIFTSLIIIGICLLISNFLRTNPLLGKILFGAKMPAKAISQHEPHDCE